MAQVKKNFVEDLPIILGDDKIQNRIVLLTNDLLFKCQNRYDSRKKFINYIQKAYEPKGIPEKLEFFDSLSFKDFCAELKKQKVKLSASEQMDLLQLFEDNVKIIVEESKEINTLYNSLDSEVFNLYGIDALTAKRIQNEIKIDIL